MVVCFVRLAVNSFERSLASICAASIGEVLRKRRHIDIWEVGSWFERVYLCWLNCFAIPGLGRFIRSCHRRLERLWMRALGRRSVQRPCGYADRPRNCNEAPRFRKTDAEPFQ